MRYLKSKVTEVTVPAADHALIRFAGEEPIEGEPGQFVMVRGEWGSHLVLGRAFSLVEAGEQGAVLVRAVGEGTRLLCAMEPGDEISVLGPLGKGFVLDENESGRPVLVAGGVGVAPLAFLAKRLSEAGVRPLFLYGARTSDDLPMAEELEEVAELVVTTEDGSRGEKGFVTTPLDRALEDDPDARIFSCGPEGMLEAVAKIAVKRGTPCQVALESPMACGMGTCKGCAVLAADGRYRYVCSDGPAFEAALIYGGEK